MRCGGVGGALPLCPYFCHHLDAGATRHVIRSQNAIFAVVACKRIEKEDETSRIGICEVSLNFFAAK